jgi:hypothetical protein
MFRHVHPLLTTVLSRRHLRLFTGCATYGGTQLPPRPTVPESEIWEAFLRGSGPGGQKIVHALCSVLGRCSPDSQNKTSCAVQLKHLPTGLVVKSQATRSRSQNRKIARRLLAEKLEFLEKGPESRVAAKGEVKRKKKASADKKKRRKYRARAGQGAECLGGSEGDEELEWRPIGADEDVDVDMENGETDMLGRKRAQKAKHAAEDKIED